MDSSHPDWCVMVPHCGFDLHFSDKITSPGWMHETSARGAWCTGKTQSNRMEREVGGGDWGIHVNPWLIDVNVWQKPLQYCKVISLQLIKINGKKKKGEKSRHHQLVQDLSWLVGGETEQVPCAGRSSVIWTFCWPQRSQEAGLIACLLRRGPEDGEGHARLQSS